MKSLFTRFIEDESGATAIEYGLIAALIILALITAANQLVPESEMAVDTSASSE